MRNVDTREGYEFWDKICAVQSYAFLLSPDGRRVVKTPDIGDWIDKHEAQVIVDHAQEEFNVVKAERDALQLMLNDREEQVNSLEQRRHAEQQACQAAERRVEVLEGRSKLTNEELIVIARNAALNSPDRYNYMPCLPEEAYKWFPHYWVIEAMRAALNPAEPAKDEHVCAGCGSKAWTANCSECVPY